MKKKEFHKIPISEFISDKKLKKIRDIIDNADCLETAYDKIESLLSKKFVAHGLGTNRIVLKHRDKKFKGIIFKVAGDSHGIEANYREFYNGDLDKSLTYSYSISDDGLFVVQEEVTTFNSKDMEKHKKDVSKMLDKLSKKILLVDCRLSNFRNFGFRKNGEIVLLDHGDTVPLPKYQTDNIVNIDEESNVSLRCKKMINSHSEKPKECGGKLKYVKGYAFLKCESCGATMLVNDAYREFYCNKNINVNIHNDFIDGLGFDVDEWSKQIKDYANSVMGDVNKESNKKCKGECEMKKEKMIDQTKCTQIRGYWVPEDILGNPAYSMLVTSLKVGKISPKEFIKTIGLNPKDYSVKIEDHEPNDERRGWNEVSDKVIDKVCDIISNNTSNGFIKFDIEYKNIENQFGVNIDTISREREIVKGVTDRLQVKRMIYKKDRFTVVTQGISIYQDDNGDVSIDYNDIDLTKYNFTALEMKINEIAKKNLDASAHNNYKYIMCDVPLSDIINLLKSINNDYDEIFDQFITLYYDGNNKLVLEAIYKLLNNKNLFKFDEYNAGIAVLMDKEFAISLMYENSSYREEPDDTGDDWYDADGENEEDDDDEDYWNDEEDSTYQDMLDEAGEDEDVEETDDSEDADIDSVEEDNQSKESADEEVTLELLPKPVVQPHMVFVDLDENDDPDLRIILKKGETMYQLYARMFSEKDTALYDIKSMQLVKLFDGKRDSE